MVITPIKDNNYKFISSIHNTISLININYLKILGVRHFLIDIETLTKTKLV
jgi:hypothetical protein